MKLGVCIPTRGVIFANTIQTALLNPELPAGSVFFAVIGLPIPDAHNECVRRALLAGCTHIWFVEEDMEIPAGGLNKMLELANAGAQYVVIDYPLSAKVRTTCMFADGKPLWSGFGCTMIAREVFEQIGEPYFSTEYEVLLEQLNPIKYKIVQCRNPEKVYGHFDIWFGLLCKEYNIPITIVPDMICNHLRLKTWERKTINQGTHEIYRI